ncbi:hypothetical protein L1987_13547 [Smallanthus sonchifolius]|uniref:Uncharacterized protein n=1 Tax=Smallanthus sonchifolius TaxID=185202 RepID=A0ACB9JGU6_9ASTR|nr:hypothetical protein L1987_13547 [Smallanthus sonchifolius]
MSYFIGILELNLYISIREDEEHDHLTEMHKKRQRFKELRMVEAKPGIGFIEYGDEMQATVTRHSLQGFNVKAHKRPKEQNLFGNIQGGLDTVISDICVQGLEERSLPRYVHNLPISQGYAYFHLSFGFPSKIGKFLQLKSNFVLQHTLNFVPIVLRYAI